MFGRRSSWGSENRKNTTKSLATIPSRKRKSDEDEHMQPDLQRFFKISPKSTNLQQSVGPLQSIIRPSSRVPLGPIRLGGENQDLSAASAHLSASSTQTTQPRKKPRRQESWNEFRSFIAEPVVRGVRGEAPLPDFRWADKQLMWDLMVKRETGTYTRAPATSMLNKHPAIQPKMRAILFDWLIEVCEVYRLHRETFYLALDFMDRYLGRTEAVPKTRLQLIGVTCLFIGAKLEEIYPPKLQEFAYVTDGACTEEEILVMELEILKRLNWSLSPVTPNSWLRTFMQVLEGPKEDDGTSFTIPAFNGLPFSRVMQLLDLVVLDFGSLDFPYSVLATSALYHVEGERVALSVSGYAWAHISRCVLWMSAFAFAIRERSPLQIKSFHGVAPEDSHHLQNHVVDLGLLESATARLAVLAECRRRESPDISSQQTVVGLDQTPQEQEGDIMYPEYSGSIRAAHTARVPAHTARVTAHTARVPAHTARVPAHTARVSTHPALLSPHLDGDYWKHLLQPCSLDQLII